MKKDHIVGLILDPFFGIKIMDMAVKFHCWVVESAENLKFKEEVWQRIDENSDPLESGITTFELSSNDLEKECIDITEVIIDHHNEYQHDPGINILKVFGVNLTEKLKNEMENFGFNKFEYFQNGFLAMIK